MRKTRWAENFLFWPKLWKNTMLVEPFCLLVRTFEKDSVGSNIFSFDQNFRKRQYGLKYFDLRWKLSKKTLWVEPYCLLVRTFKKDNIGWNILWFVQNFQKRRYGLNHFGFFYENFFKRQYWFNNGVFWSELSKKTIWV